jgi:hypothetical protein
LKPKIAANAKKPTIIQVMNMFQMDNRRKMNLKKMWKALKSIKTVEIKRDRTKRKKK